MNLKMNLLLVAALCAAPAPMFGQDPGPEAGAPPAEAHRPLPPIVAALDTNQDGVIDAKEIENAPAALSTLDLNHDGKLTFDELRPAGGPGPRPNGPGPNQRRSNRYVYTPDNGGTPPDAPALPPPHPAPPLISALDTNDDGVIDATEIANAASSLKKLDKNGDGALSHDEYAPAHGEGPGPGHGPGMRPLPPVIVALDTNKDGTIDAAELANAPAALKTLDKNNDGKLTEDELRPTPPAGAPPHGGPRPGDANHPHPVPPVIAALDVNGDGVIDASEIANATAELKTLDKNGDGKLTREELRPTPPADAETHH